MSDAISELHVISNDDAPHQIFNRIVKVYHRYLALNNPSVEDLRVISESIVEICLDLLGFDTKLDALGEANADEYADD